MSFYAKKYTTKINNVLDDAIKTALFIDENALEPYSRETKSDISDRSTTEQLSKDIYRLFYKSKVSLTIHKFKDVNSAKPYLVCKDLILLDWHLDGIKSGEEFALELLYEIVAQKHIHFCCIYTNNDESDVLNNCISYFSGHDQSFYNSILDEFDDDDEFKAKAKPHLDKILSFPLLTDNNEITKYKGNIFKNDQAVADSINNAECFDKKINFEERIKSIALAFSPLKKSLRQTPIIEKIDIDNKVLIINNTLVFVIKKNHDTDKKLLIEKIKEHLLIKNKSFLLMLGIDLQNNIRRRSSLIPRDFLDLCDGTFAYHWKQSIISNNENYFYEFLRTIMLDQLEKKCMDSKFELLDSGMLYKNIPRPSIRELCKLNSFYNGFYNNIETPRKIYFGDIFYKDDGTYFLCITSVCDCLQPENIKNRFFFVKGIKHPSTETALKLGDQAFLSYIDHDTCIVWSRFDESIKVEIQKYLPIYIKPEQLFIPDNEIKDSKVKYLHPCQQEKEGTLINSVKEFVLEYKFTLRQPYAQRIANYAFTHSIRVGIDFGKFDNNE